MNLFEARYTAVPGTDESYGQGAVERNDLRHREISHFIWVIQPEDDASALEWQERLNAAVDPSHGSFRVARATAEEERQLACGEIELQR